MNKNGVGWRSKAGQNVTIVGGDILKSTWIRLARIFQLRLDVKGGSMFKFDGFNEADFTRLKDFLKDNYSIELKTETLSLKGWNWGDCDVQGSSLVFSVSDLTSFELPLNEVSSTSVNKQEITMEFHHDDIANDGSDSLVEMRFFVPGKDSEETDAMEPIDDADKTPTAADLLAQKILSKADVLPASGKGLLVFEEMHVLTPRGRYDFEFFPSFLKIHGKTYDYKIKYSSIVRLFSLPKADGKSVFFVMSVEPAIRQGHTSYPHIVVQLSTQELVEDLEINIPSDVAEDDRISALRSVPKNGQLDEVFCVLFRQLLNKKITSPKGFKGYGDKNSIKCSLKAHEGFLFPLERSFFFVHQPPTHILFEEIASVKFARVSDVGSGASGNRTFDLYVYLSNGSAVTFASIQRSEYSSLYNFLISKGLTISNFEESEKVIMNEEYEKESDEEDEEEDTGSGRKKRRAAKEAIMNVRTELKNQKTEEDEESDEEFVGEDEDSEDISDEDDKMDDI